MARGDKKVEILRAAMKIFARHGYDGAKIEDIARVAGIGKGTVYQYFESKKHLFEEMIHYGYELYKEKLLEVLARGRSVREKLIGFSRFQAEFIVEHRDILQSVQGQALSQELKDWVLNENLMLKRLFDDLVAEGIKRGELRPDLDREIAAYCILGTVAHYNSMEIYLGRKTPHEINHEEVADTVLKGIGLSQRCSP